MSVWAHLFGCLAGVMFGLVLLKDSNEEVGCDKKINVKEDVVASQSKRTNATGLGEEGQESERDDLCGDLPCHDWTQRGRIFKFAWSTLTTRSTIPPKESSQPQHEKKDC